MGLKETSTCGEATDQTEPQLPQVLTPYYQQKVAGSSSLVEVNKSSSLSEENLSHYAWVLADYVQTANEIVKAIKTTRVI